MIVLPWPGETAWITPSAKAMPSETRIASGVRSVTSTSAARFSATPPGTAPGTAPAPTVAPLEVVVAGAPAIGWASGGDHGASVGPPAEAVTATDRWSSGWARSSFGYAVSRLDTPSPSAAGLPAAPAITVPFPSTTISRQPMRSAKEESSKVMAVAAIGLARAASYSHTRRMVVSPPAPAGSESPADIVVSDRACPSAVRRRSWARVPQALTRSCSSSAGATAPSPSRSIRWLSWNAGISARSMTTSSEIAAGPIRSAAKWLIVKLPRGWASASVGTRKSPKIAAAAANRRREPPGFGVTGASRAACAPPRRRRPRSRDRVGARARDRVGRL